MYWVIRTNKTTVYNEKLKWLENMNNKELVKIFKAVGNERRLLILKHIFSKKELTVGQISQLIDLSFKSVSRHMSVLSNVNLVDARKVNLSKFYFIDTKSSKEFIKFLKS